MSKAKEIVKGMSLGRTRAAMIQSEYQNGETGNDDPEGVALAVLRDLRAARPEVRKLAAGYIMGRKL